MSDDDPRLRRARRLRSEIDDVYLTPLQDLINGIKRDNRIANGGLEFDPHASSASLLLPLVKLEQALIALYNDTDRTNYEKNGQKLRQLVQQFERSADGMHALVESLQTLAEFDLVRSEIAPAWGERAAPLAHKLTRAFPNLPHAYGASPVERLQPELKAYANLDNHISAIAQDLKNSKEEHKPGCISVLSLASTFFFACSGLFTGVYGAQSAAEAERAITATTPREFVATALALSLAVFVSSIVVPVLYNKDPKKVGEQLEAQAEAGELTEEKKLQVTTLSFRESGQDLFNQIGRAITPKKHVENLSQMRDSDITQLGH